MSYKTELQGNNTDLQAILDTVNALPEAGGGLETCTMTITNNGGLAAHGGIGYTTVVDGKLVVSATAYDHTMWPLPVTITVLCSSLVWLNIAGGAGSGTIGVGAVNFDKGDAKVVARDGMGSRLALQAPSESGTHVTVTLMMDD